MGCGRRLLDMTCTSRESVQGADGAVVKMTGDGVMAVFETARNAVTASLAAQLALHRESWGETGRLLVRMGLHVGEASGDGTDYHGQAVNRAARLHGCGPWRPDAPLQPHGGHGHGLSFPRMRPYETWENIA